MKTDNLKKWGNDETERFKETEITVCAGRWKLSRARKPSKRKKSSMHRKSKSTPTTSRVARNMQRSYSHESLPQLRSGIFPPYAVPISNVQPCYVGTPVPQFTVLHSISSDTSQPPTGATVTPSEWNQQSNVATSWYTGTHQNVLHASTTANPVVHVTAEPNGYAPAVVPASSTAWEKTSDCTTSAPTNFNFDQYRDGDGLSGWDENQEYSAAPTHSNNESAPARKPAGAIPVKTASNRTKPSTHKKNVHKKKQVHGRSLSATTGSRRTARKKKISDAIQSLKEIMRQAGVPATPNDQNGIIQAAVKYMKLLRATLESATNQFAELAERFAKVASCPVPVLQPLGALPPPLPMPPLTSSILSPKSTLPMPPLTSSILSPKSSPNSSDSIRSFNFAFSGEEGSPRPVQLPLHPRPVMPAHQARRRRRRRKRQPQQQQAVPVHATSNSFAEEVRNRIHSRHESVGATDFAKLSMDQDTEHSDLGMSLDTKMMTDGSFFNLNTQVDVDFLDPTITADPGLLQSLDDLSSPQKNTLFGTPPPSPQVMLSPASMCTSPTLIFN